MKRSPAREKILDTATKLFGEFGIKAVSADRIIEEAGISKPTFYSHFPQKSELILAYLKTQDHLWFERLKKVETSDKAPKQKLLGLFDALGEWFRETEFHGCAFMRAMSDADVQSNQDSLSCVHSHFSETANLVQRLAELIDKKKAPQLTSEVMLLIAGCLMIAEFSRSDQPALDARRILEARLKS